MPFIPANESQRDALTPRKFPELQSYQIGSPADQPLAPNPRRRRITLRKTETEQEMA